MLVNVVILFLKTCLILSIFMIKYCPYTYLFYWKSNRNLTFARLFSTVLLMFYLFIYSKSSFIYWLVTFQNSDENLNSSRIVKVASCKGGKKRAVNIAVNLASAIKIYSSIALSKSYKILSAITISNFAYLVPPFYQQTY